MKAVKSTSKCLCCKEFKDKSEFFPDKTRPIGVGSKCKSCLNKRDRYSKRKAYFVNYQKEYRLHYPDKKKAVLKVNQSIRTGLLEKKPCEVCGDVKSQGHHPDYSRPLDVIWLCSKHHQRLHRDLKNTPKSESAI